MFIALTINKMRLLVFCVLVIFSATYSFHQHDYHFIIERANVTYYNKSHADNVKLRSYYVTRYSKRFNFSIDLVQDLDVNLITSHIEGRKFQSNEYRLFPFNYSENACASLHNRKFGKTLDQFETNFISNNCFVKKGNYYANDIHYDDSKFPPYAPRGRYLLIGRLLYKKNIMLYVMEAYIEIKPQNPLEKTVG